MSSSEEDEDDIYPNPIDVEEEEEMTLLERIEQAELLLQQLKINITAAGDNKAAAVSTLFTTGEQLKDKVVELIDEIAPQEANDVFNELAFILNVEDDIDREDRTVFWITFHDKLKSLGSTTIEFRKSCFHTRLDLSSNGDNIFHLICKLDPPVEVVKTLIDIIPLEESLGEFNNLACTLGNKGYPLHVVLKHGGSLDLVKLLIEIDSDNNALHMKDNSVIFTLVQNQNRAQQAFSDILRYLVLTISDFDKSVLIKLGNNTNYSPLSLFWVVLQLEIAHHGRQEHPLDNDDFVFLLKATCYHYLQLQEGVNDEGDRGYNQRARDIGSISLSKAFTIFLPGLIYYMDPTDGQTYSKGKIEELLSADSKFLEEKNSDEDYPIHRMIMNHSYFFMAPVKAEDRERFCHNLIEIILRAVPECARQLDKDGRLPLQIASDPTTLHVLKRNSRYELVRNIWKAYPEAASVIDNLTGLPSFALAARDSNEGKELDFKEMCDRVTENREIDESITSSFFLLRQYPEILSEYDVSNSNPGITLNQIIKGGSGIESDDKSNSNAKRQKSSGHGINLSIGMSYERYCQLKEDLSDSG